MSNKKSKNDKSLFLGRLKKRLTCVMFGMCGCLIAPKLVFAKSEGGITAGKLAETGDMMAMLAIVTGAIAAIALIVSIISKRLKSKSKSTWKYPF